MPQEQVYYQRPGYVASCGIVLSVLAIAAVLTRFWSRFKYKQGLKTDDWLIIPALILTVGQGINLVYGVGKKSLATRAILPPDFVNNPNAANTPQLILMSQLEFAYILMIPLALGFTKLSFLAFYMRIFTVSKRSAVAMFLWTMIAIVAWGSNDDIAQNCMQTFKAVYGLCVSDFITDVLIILTPIPLIWNMKLSTRKKMATSGVFLLGIVAIGASLTRLIVTVQLAQEGFDPNEDKILTVTTYMYWGMVESGVSVVVACLPHLSFLARVVSFDSTGNPVIARALTGWSLRRSTGKDSQTMTGLENDDRAVRDVEGAVGMSPSMIKQ
ncbi:hypothetical protein PT974_09580 [Cladobotryum mycophilum]|uniref:Rhodopsin domain-containing protein n=1 Tax=Cladobotryum mycophilum TaxID=491253 RepID=A0ABR0SGN9_9HYPO